MKFLLFANTDWYLYNFRRSLAQRLRQEGHEVVLVSPPGAYGPRLGELGFRWLPFDFSTRSTNPLAEICVLYRLWRLYRRECPDLCHHFTIKCVLYGSIAAHLAGVPRVVNAVTGLGHIFTDEGLKARLLRPLVRSLYRFALGGRWTRVIFQNQEDRDYFVGFGLIEPTHTYLIRGSGVDTNYFAPKAIDKEPGDSVNILFASRLIREKGVFELLYAMRQLRGIQPKVRLIIAGDIYPGNPSSLSESDLISFWSEENVEYRGHIDDIRGLIEEADVVILPSYREGTPRILIEAASMGKPIIATDIAGCRGLVVDGENGLLVPVKTIGPLVDSISALTVDHDLRNRMGRASREIVLKGFDERIVLEMTMSVYLDTN